METSETITPWQPVASGERYAALDVLRGLALFGVLMMNLDMCFRVSLTDYVMGIRNYSGRADYIAGALLTTLLQTKAFTLFSFSFGIGMAVQAERAAPRGVGWRLFLARRLLVLFGLGFCHMFLIWNGDILMLYAVCGLPLVLVLRWPPLLLALGGLAAIVLTYLIPFEPFMPTEENYFALAELSKQTHAGGNYFEIMLFQAREAVHLSVPLLLSVLPKTIGLMLLGVAAWRSGILREPRSHRLLLWGVLVVGALVSSAAIAWPRFSPTTLEWIRIPDEVLEACSYIPLALAYAAAVFLYFGSATTAKLARPLAAVGQMALTNYLLQSVTLSLLFYGYGFALQGQLGPAMASLIGITLYAAQVGFSLAWMSHFQFGPVEWFWRTLTYGWRQPIFRAKRADA